MEAMVDWEHGKVGNADQDVPLDRSCMVWRWLAARSLKQMLPKPWLHWSRLSACVKGAQSTNHESSGANRPKRMCCGWLWTLIESHPRW